MTVGDRFANMDELLLDRAAPGAGLGPRKGPKKTLKKLKKVLDNESDMRYNKKARESE